VFADHSRCLAARLEAHPEAGGGGRTWWAHIEFTRLNLEPTKCVGSRASFDELPWSALRLTRSVVSGSINEVGWRFQSFRINDLELVAQTIASWNQIASWMKQLECLRRTAV
jgi:hypothetical protein